MPSSLEGSLARRPCSCLSIQAARQIRSLPYTLSSPSEPTDAAFPCKCSSSGQRQRMAPAASAMSAQLLLDAGPKLFRVTPTCNNPANCGCRVRSHGMVLYLQHPVPQVIPHTKLSRVRACTEHQRAPALLQAPLHQRSIPLCPACLWGRPLHHIVTRADAASRN